MLNLNVGNEDPAEKILFEIYNSIPESDALTCELKASKEGKVEMNLKASLNLFSQFKSGTTGYLQHVKIVVDKKSIRISSYSMGGLEIDGTVQVSEGKLWDRWVEVWRRFSHEVSDLQTRLGFIQKIEADLKSRFGGKAYYFEPLIILADLDLETLPYNFKEDKWEWKTGTYLEFKNPISTYGQPRTVRATSEVELEALFERDRWRDINPEGNRGLPNRAARQELHGTNLEAQLQKLGQDNPEMRRAINSFLNKVRK